MILSLVIGIVLFITGAVFCFLPEIGFLAVGQFMGIGMLLSGGNGLIQCIFHRSFRRDFFFALLSVFLGGFLLFDPRMAFMTDALIMYFAAGWLLLLGAAQIWIAVMGKKTFHSHWWMVFISGILNVLLGGMSIANPLAGMLAMSRMIAFYFINMGIGLVLCGIAFRE